MGFAQKQQQQPATAAAAEAIAQHQHIHIFTDISWAFSFIFSFVIINCVHFGWFFYALNFLSIFNCVVYFFIEKKARRKQKQQHRFQLNTFRKLDFHSQWIQNANKCDRAPVTSESFYVWKNQRKNWIAMPPNSIISILSHFARRMFHERAIGGVAIVLVHVIRFISNEVCEMALVLECDCNEQCLVWILNLRRKKKKQKK